jgi:phospholipid/cholesterol/gamma-HCH transport system ATP-binding protein
MSSASDVSPVPAAAAAPARFAPDARITVQDLTMAFGDFTVMRDLNFTVRRGDVFIIMGGSGCGKSTLLRHMIGLLEPATGEFLYGDESFTRATPAAREALLRRLGVL